jgi:type IX secretion system PorP/SprF family membrane protein
LLIILLCLPGLLLHAQGDAVISQYVLQPFLFNPAAAGSQGGIQAGALYRNQWGGLEGAPQSFLLQANLSSKNNRLGYGGWLGRDTWGPYQQHQVFGAFSYRIPAGKGHFAMGLQAGLQQFNTNWSELSAFQAGDVTFTGNPGNNVFIPNFGAGLYFNNDKLSAGFSVPRLLGSTVFDSQYITQINYYTVNFDYRLQMGDNFGLVPATLIKWTKSSAQVDLNLYMVFAQSVWVGAGYRSDKSANFSLQYHLAKDRNNFRLAYSYDLANGAYRDITGSGTHEISLVYVLKHPETPSAPVAP